MNSSKKILKKVPYHEVIENSSLIALASEKEIKYSIEANLSEGKCYFKSGKMPAYSWSKNPRDYCRYNDNNYGSAIICDYIDKLGLYLAVIDLDIPKTENGVSIDDLVRITSKWMNETHTRSTPSGGYHIYLLSENKPSLKQPSFNLDYQTNTGNSKGKYIVTNFRYGIQDLNGNTINLREYCKKDKNPSIEELRFNKEYYEHYTSSPDEILVVESSDDVLTDIITNIKDEGLDNPCNTLSEKNELLSNKFFSELVNVVKPYAKEGQRHRLALALSGYLHKKKYSLGEVEEIFQQVFIDDEEIDQRIQLLYSTFRKDSKTVAGLNKLGRF